MTRSCWLPASGARRLTDAPREHAEEVVGIGQADRARHLATDSAGEEVQAQQALAVVAAVVGLADDAGGRVAERHQQLQFSGRRGGELGD